MEVGQIVDYVEEYNQMHDQDYSGGGTSHKTEGRRTATQADWDAFLG